MFKLFYSILYFICPNPLSAEIFSIFGLWIVGRWSVGCWSLEGS